MSEPQINPNLNKDQDKVEFKSSDIGIKTAKVEDSFETHKQKQAAQKQQEKKQRKVFFIVLAVVLGVATLGLIIWLVIYLVDLATRPAPVPETPVTTITTGSTEEIQNLSNAASNAYQSTESEEAANQAAEEIFNTAFEEEANADFQNQVRLSQIIFYAQSDQYEKIRATVDSVDPAALTADQQATLYNLAAAAFRGNNDEKTQEYQDKAYEAAQATGQGAGGGE